MPNLRSLRWQHEQASGMTLRLVNLIDAHRPGDDAFPIALQLARWVSLLRTHLATEDEWLYPALLACGDVRVAATAREFQIAMGHLAATLEAFDRHWSSSVVIGAAFPRFRREAFALFAAFERRIALEDDRLYALADARPAALPNAA